MKYAISILMEAFLLGGVFFMAGTKIQQLQEKKWPE